MSFAHIPSKQRRGIEKSIAKENAKFTDEFVELPIPEMRNDFTAPIKAFRNRDFLAQIYQDKNNLRVTVSRTTLNSKGDFRDGITWDELQKVKNKIGFAEMDAIEIYPAENDEANYSNLRHLWIVEKLDFAWRNNQPKIETKQ